MAVSREPHRSPALSLPPAADFVGRSRGAVPRYLREWRVLGSSFGRLAGIDAGNHCFCGTESDIASVAVRAKIRPLAECEVSPCHADKQQKCGGVDRLLVYSFVCTPGDTTVALPSEQTARGPLPTHYGSANGTVWLPAEEDFTLQTEDSWFCEYQACLRPCRSLRLS